LDHLIDAMQFHFQSAAAVQKQLRSFCQDDPELRQSISFLASLPGVGSITATHALARLGECQSTPAEMLGRKPRPAAAGPRLSRLCYGS